MELNVSVEKKDLFQMWLLFLNPILKLGQDVELPILASLLTLHYTYSQHLKYNDELLNSLILSKEVKEGIKTRLGLSDRGFTKAWKKLERREYITDSGINPKLYKIYPIDGKFSLTVNLNVGDDRVRDNTTEA
jgi:hypothetical protein